MASEKREEEQMTVFGGEKTPLVFGYLRPDLNNSFVTYSSLTQKSHTALPVVWQTQSGKRVPGRAIELLKMLRFFPPSW